MLASEEVGDIFRDGKAYDVHVFSTPASRDSLNDVAEMQIDTPDGKFVQLQDVADVRIVPTPNAIHRESYSRTITVGANVEGSDLGSVVEELQQGLDRSSSRSGFMQKCWVSSRSGRQRSRASLSSRRSPSSGSS